MIKKLIFSATLFSFAITASAQIQWYSSLEAAKNVARLQNKLIVVDFTADWCPPCKRMDMYVWPDADVDSLAEKFVSVKIDIDRNRTDAISYNVRSIPRILIIDAYGEIMEDLNGYQDENDLIRYMRSYPANVRIIHAAMDKLNKNNNEDFFGNYEIGLAYQKYLPLLEQPAYQAFYNRSMQYFKTAEKIAGKSDQPAMEQKAIIAQCLNYTFTGKHDKAIKELVTKFGLENFEPSNQGYALYVLSFSYHMEGNESLYKQSRTKLQSLPGGSYFANMLDQQLSSL